MNELDQLRAEADQLKNAIRVSNLEKSLLVDENTRMFQIHETLGITKIPIRPQPPVRDFPPCSQGEILFYNGHFE